MEARTSTITTTVLESKGGELNAPATRGSKRTMMDDLYTTFSSPVAWVLVLALIITWSAVAIIVFDLVDTKSLEGGIQHMSSERVKEVHKAMDESGNWMNSVMTFLTNLLSPEEEEEEVEWQAVKKKGEFLPVRKKVSELQAKEIIQKEEDEMKIKEEEEEDEDEMEEEEEETLAVGEDEEEEDDEEDEKDDKVKDQIKAKKRKRERREETKT